MISKHKHKYTSETKQYIWARRGAVRATNGADWRAMLKNNENDANANTIDASTIWRTLNKHIKCVNSDEIFLQILSCAPQQLQVFIVHIVLEWCIGEDGGSSGGTYSMYYSRHTTNHDNDELKFFLAFWPTDTSMFDDIDGECCTKAISNFFFS